MSLDELLTLAKRRDKESRERLIDQLADYFLDDSGRLTAQERALMTTILMQLIGEVEKAVRAALAKRLVDDPSIPPELIETLADDDADIAAPLLLSSSVIRDPALMRIVRDRSREHRLAIASRRNLSTEVSDAIVDRAAEDADTELLETLVRNGHASLSRRAAEFLVEEAKRTSALQEPLVNRVDIPSDLAMRLYWWVAAALKQRLLKRFTVDELDLHEAIEESVLEIRNDDRTRRSLSASAWRLVEKGEADIANPRAIIGFVRSDRMALACTAFARMTGLDPDSIRITLLEGPMEALAILCRRADFSKEQFITLFSLCAAVWPGGARALPPARIAAASSYFTELEDRQVRKVINYWLSDPGFRDAEAQVAAS